MNTRVFKRLKRHTRVRKSIKGTTDRPRFAVFKSNQHIYAQIIDDSQSKTLFSESDLKVKQKITKINQAFEIGKKLAEKAVAGGIKSVVFDRGGFLYHGRIAKVAEGARDGGLKF